MTASLMMYDQPEVVHRANDALWAAIRDGLYKRGQEAPQVLARGGIYDRYWLDPDLSFAQTCGYPYVSNLKGKVRLVATPVFSYPGGSGARRASYIVVAEDSDAKSLSDLKGKRAAINDRLSNSGMNLFRAAIAPLAGGEPFFALVIVTGGHINSIAAIREGRAEVAAIDSITWGLHARHAPAKIAGVRIIGETPMGPGLPYITKGTASDERVAALRESLSDAMTTPMPIMAGPVTMDARDVLGLTGIEILDDGDYAELERLRDEAFRLGYPKVA